MDLNLDVAAVALLLDLLWTAALHLSMRDCGLITGVKADSASMER
jgi:hypothetical protein